MTFASHAKPQPHQRGVVLTLRPKPLYVGVCMAIERPHYGAFDVVVSERFVASALAEIERRRAGA